MTLPASPHAAPRFPHRMRWALSGLAAFALLCAVLATLAEPRDMPLPSDEPTLTDMYLTPRQPGVGAVTHLRATYTNRSTEPADVRLRLFGTRREFTVLGPIPPPLMHVAPGQQLAGDIAFIVGQPGAFGGEFVVTDEGFVKLAEQPFSELAIRPLHPLALLLATLMLLLLLPTAVVLVLIACAPPDGHMVRESPHTRLPTRVLPAPLITAVSVSAGISLTSVALAPILRLSIFAAVPLLVAYPTLGLLAPAVALLVGRMVQPRRLAVGGSVLAAALLAWIATETSPCALIGAILGGAAASLGALSVRRATPVGVWAGFVTLLGVALWISWGWEIYRTQVEAVLASLS